MGDSEKKDSQKDSEDVEIDFGKIKNLFGGKKKEHRHEHEGHGHHDDSLVSENDARKAAVAGEKEEKSGSEDADKSDDEIEISFGKIKGLFGKKREETEKRGEGKAKPGESDEDSPDISNAASFAKKHHLMILTIIALFASVWIGMDIRLDAGDLAFTENWARNSIDTTIRNDISNFVQQQYPNLPDRNREALVNEELSKARSSGTYTFKTGQYTGQAISIEQQTQLTSQSFKDFFQDEKGLNYMPDIDPYYWLRYAENIIELGHAGDEVRNGVQWDNHQLAPIGRSIAPQDTFYPKMIVLFHRLIGKPFGTMLGKNAELARTMMFFPVFIIGLTSLVVFLLTRRIAGGMAAFFAATMAGAHGSLVSRTMFGHADSDALTILLAVLVLWLFVEAFAARSIKWKIALAALAGLATGIYRLSWGGWWWIFDFIMAASVGTIGLFILYDAFIRTKKGTAFISSVKQALKENVIRRAIATTGAYFLSSGIFVTIFSQGNIKDFLLTPIASVGFRTIKTPVIDTSMPNVLRTVAELNEGSVQQAINQIGSDMFYIAVIGILLIVGRAGFEAIKREKDHGKVIRDVFFAAVLTLWFIATLYAVTKGIRFTLLLVPAFSIAFGATFGIVANYVASWVNREFKFNRFAALAIMFIVLMFVFPGLTLNSSIVQASKNIVRNDVPLVNDAWHSALTKIKANSEEDAIITSWWDFGHHFKQIADRPVTFDGTTQGTIQAHWVGRFFSTKSEREAVGILRMLDCGAETGTRTLREILGDNVEAVMLTKRIIIQNMEEARSTLIGEGLTEEQAEDVLGKTHCEPPEAFVIASEDMIGKSGVWGHFGGWNFTKADIWKATREMDREEAAEYMKAKFGMPEEEAGSIFEQMQFIADDRAADAWISPWPGLSSEIHGCGRQGNLVGCGDGLIVNLTDYNAWYQTQQGNLHPVSLVYLTPEGEVVEKKFSNNTVPQHLSAMLVPQGSDYFRVLASPELAGGMFARMFFLQGHGLECFSLLTRERGFTGTDIYVWEVDWECSQNTIIPELMPAVEKTEVSAGDEVTLNYIGYFEDGRVFDTSITGDENISGNTTLDESHEYSPFTFTAGSGSVIPGFDQGVIGAKAGEERVIEVPPELGYNQPGHPLYNQTIYFRIKVVSIK